MFPDDSVDTLTDAEIQRLMAQPVSWKRRQVSSPDAGSDEIKTGPRRGRSRRLKAVDKVFDPIPGAGINQTISITLELPAYLVAGMKSEGEINLVVRMAIRDWLIAKGKTWWQPRFNAAIMAKVVEDHYESE